MGLELTRRSPGGAVPFRIFPADPILDAGTVVAGDVPAERTVVIECLEGTGEATCDVSWIGLSDSSFKVGILPLRLTFKTATLPPGPHRATVRLAAGSYRHEISVHLSIRAAAEDGVAQLVRALEHINHRGQTHDSLDFMHVPDKSDIGYELTDLLQVMVKHSASDLHLKVGAPATVRIDGDLIPIGDTPLTNKDCLYLILSTMTDMQRRRLHMQRYLDYACDIPGARMRVNAFVQKGTLSGAYRLLRTRMPTIEELGLPATLRRLCGLNDGLVLVTGPAGSGKSTTLAAMVDYINTTFKKHIVTIEDPIEFVHSDKSSLVTQREIGADTPNYAEALRQALRQDPNVLLVGEMRDPEAMLTAAMAAETGHLVLSTLHTPNTTQAVDRVLDTFTGDQQRQFRMLFSRILRGVVSQKLISRSDDKGRCVATEILMVTPTVASLILDAKTNEMYDLLKEGSLHGMQTFSQSLLKLHQSGMIDKHDAYRHAEYPNELRLMIEGHTTNSDYTSQDQSKLL